jgi:hypothetical protein
MKIIEQNSGFQRKMLVFPGWGFQYDIFTDLGLKYDLVYYDSLQLDSLNELIYSYIQQSDQKISILSWSMGCQIFSGFLQYCRDQSKLEDVQHQIEKVHLLSCIDKFDFPAAQEFQSDLNEDFEKWLLHFYKRVFLGDKSAWRNFEEKYLQSYIKKYSHKQLFEQLQFLLNTSLNIELFKGLNIKAYT